MNNYLKNIILTFFIAIYFVIVFSGSVGAVYNTRVYLPALYLYNLETAEKTESGQSQPNLVSEKPISSVLKVEMPTGINIPVIQCPTIKKFVIIKSARPYQLKPQIVYVRYLPRDPPTV